MTEPYAPPDWPYHDGGSWLASEPVMSNFDHKIDPQIERAIRDRDVLANYTGWNFHGVCWCDDDGLFHCAASTYGVHRMTVSAMTLLGIMESLCEAYGND